MLLVNKDNKILQYDNRFKEQFDKDKTEYVLVNDDSELAQKIHTAHEYEPILQDGKCIDIIVIKTFEQFKSEQPPKEIKPTELELLRAEVTELKAKLSKTETDIAEIKAIKK